MKILNKSLEGISQHQYLRNDFKYWNTMDKYVFSDCSKLKEIFEIVKGSVQTDNYCNVATDIPYIRVGDLSYKFGISNENLQFLNEDTEIASEKILHETDLILATIGTVGKICMARDYAGGTFSNNTVVLRLKDLQGSPVFFEKLLQTDYYIKYLSGIVSQKAQPNLQLYDLENIKFPKIESQKISLCIEKAKPIEEKIKELKLGVKSIQKIIDSVLARWLDVNIEDLYRIDNLKTLYINSSDISNKNSALRNSYRWNRGKEIQNYLAAKNSLFVPLNKFILSTQNGWSPEPHEEGLYGILGIDSIQKNTQLLLELSKFTSESKNIIDKYLIKNGDFFVSRGNTTDLVALASIAQIDDVITPTIYPDIMIRVNFTDKINKYYMAYIFNSFIGRLYFKYIAKGKNQTMVKVSETELREFMVPLPEISEQQRLVDEIQSEIDKQNNIKTQISSLRGEIDRIIEDTIILNRNE